MPGVAVAQLLDAFIKCVQLLDAFIKCVQLFITCVQFKKMEVCSIAFNIILLISFVTFNFFTK